MNHFSYKPSGVCSQKIDFDIDEENKLLFSDYERHFANIRETLKDLLCKAKNALGEVDVHPMITGSGGLTLAKHLGVPFVQEVVSVATALSYFAPQTDVALELGGETLLQTPAAGGRAEEVCGLLDGEHEEKRGELRLRGVSCPIPPETQESPLGEILSVSQCNAFAQEEVQKNILISFDEDCECGLVVVRPGAEHELGVGGFCHAAPPPR